MLFIGKYLSMETKKIKICPYCGMTFKWGDNTHLKNCSEWKIFLKNNESDIIEKYINEHSILELSKEYNIPYPNIVRIIKSNGLETRNLRDSKSTKRVKEKYESTMMEHWGTKHNFDKNCESRKKWEKRLFDEEGITNVFQRKEVIEKIKNTLHERYTNDEIYNNYVKGSTLEYWVEKLRRRRRNKKI